MDRINSLINGIGSLANSSQLNQYSLSIDQLNDLTMLSIYSIDGHESLSEPWYYKITFTSTNKQIDINSILNQPASLTFHAPDPIKQLIQLSSLTAPAQNRTIYGVITEFSMISVSKDEARYQVILNSRLALLANEHRYAIYQNQSVVDVVEDILRSHGFTGIEYRLDLKNSYPAREFITQWQESDLAFIQRILADIGIWFRFETHSEHSCDVMVISDYEQGFDNKGHLPFKPLSGMNDVQQNSIWNLQFRSKTKQQQVSVNDYNYRTAKSNLKSNVNTQIKDTTTYGNDYRYGEHYKQKGSLTSVESGHWYAQIRHEYYISDKIIIRGECNDYQLMPGQIIIPFEELKPYRPAPIAWPKVSGTLPARVTSPDNDIYGYIDTQGRYRVKFDFDLTEWKKGEESLWVRLAKPYAGDTYGFHFPLIDGTEVAIGFTSGNPDRPYIAHAMHDSSNPDHVSTSNKHRNVIRTPANNKLRMDDKREQEHIKLATEYGKTQLNLGHLVNSKKQQRGEGFELRTDEFGAIRASKGVYLTTISQEKATGEQLDMKGTIKQIEKSLDISQALIGCGKVSGAELAEITEQQALFDASNQLQESTVVIHGEQGITQISPKSIQHAANENIIATAGNNASINIFKKLSMAAGEMISIFAHKLGIKLIAASGRVQIQAQSDEMELTAQKNMFITSCAGKITINAQNELLLLSGGGGIRIKNGTIEMIAPTSILQKTAVLSYSGPESIKEAIPSFEKGSLARKFKLHFNDSPSQVLKNQPYRIHFNDGTTQDGITDENGETEIIPMTELEQIKIEILKKE